MENVYTKMLVIENTNVYAKVCRQVEYSKYLILHRSSILKELIEKIWNIIILKTINWFEEQNNQ